MVHEKSSLAHAAAPAGDAGKISDLLGAATPTCHQSGQVYGTRGAGALRNDDAVMEDFPAPKLSLSERRTLQYVAEGELHATELDWVALQRLKTLGLAEERTTGMGLT